MERHRRRATAIATLAGAVAALVVLPQLSLGGPVEEAPQEVQRTAEQVQQQVREQVERALPPAQRITRPGAKQGSGGSQTRQTPTEGTYQPPLHGSNPHGQGTVATLDVQPSATRPLAGDPTGAGDPGQAREEAIVGRARGEQQADGSYHGHITIVSLFGNEVLGVDTQEGQTAHGPLEAVQAGILDELCSGSGGNICLEVLRADSTTTDNSSTNSFAAANVVLGGDDGIKTTAAESNGNISDDGQCQTAHSDSTVASASAGGQAVADVATSSSDSTECRDGRQSQQVNGRVLGLGGQGVPIPAEGCGEGTPDSETGIPTLLPIVCNATDVNGTGEAVTQAEPPYGVREALTVFALEAGGTSLLKATTSASESRAQAPPAPPAPIIAPGPGVEEEEELEPPEAPREEEEVEEPGERVPPGVTARAPRGEREAAERLPFTGAELLWVALLGALTLAGGLRLRRAVGSRDGQV